MFGLYDNCLFCAADLPAPEDRTGEGEHVIPKNIYGFWKTYDICGECKKHFGDNVDGLSLKNPQLVTAIQELNLPSADRVLDNLSYQAKDTIDGGTVKMVRKKGSFKAKVSRIQDAYFECAEVDWPKIGLEWTRHIAPASMPPERVERELNNLTQKYERLQPGGEVHSEKLGVTVRKRQTQDIQFDSKSFAPITPLIAKIAVCFLYYSLPLHEVGRIKEVGWLRSHARHGESIKDYIINWFPPRTNVPYDRWHRITMEPFGHILLLDISLFRHANWRVVLTADDQVVLKDHNNEIVEMLYFILDFRALEKKEKLLGFKYKG
ncbi:MAG: hypothetical protein GTO24_21795, partial [candidate division Zixibacteria bacterium]|nr:hypothetical protein [candidate division Zixibacteria bacterium]